VTATRRASGAASKRAGEAWEQHVSSQWLEPLRESGVIRCWHKLEPRKVGDKFVADAGAATTYRSDKIPGFAPMAIIFVASRN